MSYQIDMLLHIAMIFFWVSLWNYKWSHHAVILYFAVVVKQELHEAWFLCSSGFENCGQQEIVFLLEKRIVEDVFPYEIMKVFRTLYSLVLNQGELNSFNCFSISSYLFMSSQSFLQCLPSLIFFFFWSLHSIISVTGCPSSLLISSPYNLSLVFFILRAASTNPLLMISAFHNISNQLPFIFFYCVSILAFSHLLCNVYLSTSLHSKISLTSFPPSLLIMCPHHFNLPSLPVYQPSSSNHFIP